MPIKNRIVSGSKRKYQKTLHRFHGDAPPDHVPKALADAAGSTIQAWRAGVQHYWKDRGQKARGLELAGQVESVEPKERFRVFPGDTGSKKFEDTARRFRNPRVAVIVLNTLAYAPRVQEMLMSKRSAFEHALKTGTFIIAAEVAKGGKARALPVAQVHELIEQLLSFPAIQPHEIAARDDRDHVWRTPSELLIAPGGSFDSARNMLARYIKEIVVDAGLATEETTTGWSPHMLRHIFTSRLTRAGCPHALIKFALGHEMKGTRDVTLSYVHLSPEDLAPYMPRIKPLKPS